MREDTKETMNATPEKTVNPKTIMINADAIVASEPKKGAKTTIEQKQTITSAPQQQPQKAKNEDKKQPAQQKKQTLIEQDNPEKKFRIGKGKKSDVYLSENIRYTNLMVLGIKSSGKSDTVLPLLAKQDICNKDAGCTFVVSKKDMAYTLYAMAKKEKRTVRILKPSANFRIANEVLESEGYNYDFVSEFIDYKKAIRKKEIVIIDMEHARYKQNAIRATAMFLIQMQIDMQDTKETHKVPHYLYVDDAYLFLPFLETAITCGDDYNVASVLFFQSRSQFKMYDHDYSSLIDNNIRNTIIMNGLTFEDAKYYQEKLSYTYDNLYPQQKDVEEDKRIAKTELSMADLLNRPGGQIIYEILDSNYNRKVNKCMLYSLPAQYREEVEAKAIKERKRMSKLTNDAANKALSIAEEEEFMRLTKKKKPVNHQESTSKEKQEDNTGAIIKEMLLKGAENKPEQPKQEEPKIQETIPESITESIFEEYDKIETVEEIQIEHETHSIEELFGEEVQVQIMSEPNEGIEIIEDEFAFMEPQEIEEPKMELPETMEDIFGDLVDTQEELDNLPSINDLVGEPAAQEKNDLFDLEIEIEDAEVEDDLSMYSDFDGWEMPEEKIQPKASSLQSLSDIEIYDDQEDDDIEIGQVMDISSYKERVIARSGYKPTRIILPKKNIIMEQRVKRINDKYFSQVFDEKLKD